MKNKSELLWDEYRKKERELFDKLKADLKKLEPPKKDKTELTGPIHEYPCYGASCMICRRKVNGIVYYKESTPWEAGDRSGIMFIYFHSACYRNEKLIA
jgi:hypothetical protein